MVHLSLLFVGGVTSPGSIDKSVYCRGTGTPLIEIELIAGAWYPCLAYETIP